MVKTVTIDILTDEAWQQLQDLEKQELIHVHKQTLNGKPILDWKNKYKGAMTQQILSDVDKQLNDLRSEWE